MASTGKLKAQERLKAELSTDAQGGNLEKLAAALVGRRLDVTVPVARSGFQHGGDAGTAGRQDRRLRIEAKRYGETTALDARALGGEIDQALRRDPALEAWLLVTTQAVSEQVEQSLVQKSEDVGVPILILDWKGDGLADLAALCASAPDIVSSLISRSAGRAATALRPFADAAIARIQRDLQSWCLGFEAVRATAKAQLGQLWTSPRVSTALLGQNAAGGAQPHRITRASVMQGLDAWWAGPAADDSPAIIFGWEGDGKTWATLDWLVARSNDLPIILTIPSSAVSPISSVSEMSVRRLLADRLFGATHVRTPEHWLYRLNRMLKRPVDEGSVLVVLFDGMNQEPAVRWLDLLKVLQGPAFAGRVRVLASTRTLHFETTLSYARGLIIAATPQAVEPYDTEADGELDQMLALEGLSRADLHPDLLPLARRPRLFPLVVRFREKLRESGDVTVHRLLWEYGRDTFGVRAGRSFSEFEWRAWLAEIARKYREEGTQSYSWPELSASAARPDLGHQEVAARLSDIIDGRFAQKNPNRPGVFELDPVIVSHALGAALLNALDTVTPVQPATVENTLNAWLDPIAGLDQRAEILRAAISIFVERGGPDGSPIGGALVMAWLQSQNLTDQHRREITGLAVALPGPLLNAVEASTDQAFASARLVAVNALRSIDRRNPAVLAVIVERLKSWCAIIPCARGDEDNPLEKARNERLQARLGMTAPTEVEVLGVWLRLVEQDAGVLGSTAPSIIEGFPLAAALSVFKAAAVAQAVTARQTCWEGLKWLVLLNTVDEQPAREALRILAHTTAAEKTAPEIEPRLAGRAAALLLWMAGDECDEIDASRIDSGLELGWNYETDYLADPANSGFPLERRHASLVLLDSAQPVTSRVQRSHEMWLDPTFEPSPAFVAELVAWATSVNVAALDLGIWGTSEDYHFEMAEPALARVAPDLLADLTRKKLQLLASRTSETRYAGAILAPQHLLLTGSRESEAARSLRQSHVEPSAKTETHVRNKLLILELLEASGDDQHRVLTEADLEIVLPDLRQVLRPLSASYAEAAPRSPARRARDLVTFFCRDGAQIPEALWAWLVEIAFGTSDSRSLAFEALTRADGERFARELLERDWSWSPTVSPWENHWGSGALIAGAGSTPFDELAPRIAPWRLLEAVRCRGADPGDVRLAAAIFDRAFSGVQLSTPELGVSLSIDWTSDSTGPRPFTVGGDLEANNEDAGDQMAALQRLLDLDARRKSGERAVRAVQVAVERIQEARRSGASLYLMHVAPEDMRCVANHAPELIDRWLEGMGEVTQDFQRRVQLAEEAFLALCETLLAHDPAQGVMLWRALRRALRTRYPGRGEVEALLHIAFRVPAADAVLDLRSRILEAASSDEALYHVVLAAEANGAGAWLRGVIGQDLASASPRRVRRGLVLKTFTVGAGGAEDAWPEGQANSSYEILRRQAARSVARDGWARHWCRQYLAAATPAEAYAAWKLFMHSADQRAWLWLLDEVETILDAPFREPKLLNFTVNRPELQRMMKKKHDRLKELFLGRKPSEGIGPWTGAAVEV